MITNRRKASHEQRRVADIITELGESHLLPGNSRRWDCIFTMLLEDQRYIHEDLERLEQAIADRVADEPRNVRLLSVSTHCNPS